MIAVSSKGKSFRALAVYLAAGRSGQERDRMEWSSARNLPTNDPELAAKIMRATAEQSQRVEKPVYHLAISFDPTDRVDRVLMERIADRVLAKLELQDHQAVIVAHRDREHPHMHLLVNRVHPTTGVAWDLSHDFRRIQEVLRETEREFGLREVPGRLAPVPDRVVPDPAASTQGELRQQHRGDDVFIDRVRSHAHEFREATSWNELDARLARHGLRIERKGQGIVVTDGTTMVKASRIARDLSLRGLERRYGVPYDERHRSSEPIGLDAALRDADRHSYVKSLMSRSYDSELVLLDARRRADRAQWTAQRSERLTAALTDAFRRVYREPIEARRLFDEAIAARGPTAAVTMLRTRPDSFGELQTTTHPRFGGLMTRYDDTRSRAQAIHAAETAQALLGAPVQRPSVPADLTRDVATAERRAAQVRAALTGLPDLSSLERSLARHAQGLLPAELQRLHTVLDAPHRLALPRTKRLVRALVRNEEERER